MIGAILSIVGGLGVAGTVALCAFVPALLPAVLGALVKLFSNVWSWVALITLVLVAMVWFEHSQIVARDKTIATDTATIHTLSTDLAKQNAAVLAISKKATDDTAAAQKQLDAVVAQRPAVQTRIQRIMIYPQVKPGTCHDAAIVDLAHKAVS
jgi:hypothetical protein